MTTLTLPSTIRPAAIGSNCDAYHRNPDPVGPYLKRCRCRARFILVLRSPGDAFAVKRCQSCRDGLHRRIANGATVEILDEEEVGR